jgi:hypothetical protein
MKLEEKSSIQSGRGQRGHTRAKTPIIPLTMPGRYGSTRNAMAFSRKSRKH